MSKANVVFPLRYLPVWLFGGGLLVALVIYLSLATGGPKVAVAVNDKLGHLAAYATLMFWFGGIFTRRWQWLVLFLLCLMGVTLEYLQAFGGVREFSRFDMGANFLGVALGKKLCRFFSNGWCQLLEQRVLRSSDS